MSSRPRRALSQLQERRLVDYLEDHFLDLTRNFKKRADPSSSVPTLSAFLAAAHTLLSLILQIPPIDPSASLRTTFLLRLTGDVMDAIPGYKPGALSDANHGVLQDLLRWLEDLDNAWLTVLRSQVWDVDRREGVDLVLEVQADADADEGSTGELSVNGKRLKSTPPTQTERTRLRSLLIGGTAKMEEWMAELSVAGQRQQQGATSSDPGDGSRTEDLESALERMGLQQGFDDLFSGTLAEMGSLSAAVNVPEGMEGTC
ncbi:hypothetical protein BXZ70DRAFT_938953 [Cristinia sonorae]|uniref:Uncharacterized protein n=1 Tax=Cristinia sonorae TaxID=1940300 RepID=A0A8K0XQ73_9AGAR|nr:hypothetical protein BXZ70DRAFT_938953 [Cristinia sonorae]